MMREVIANDIFGTCVTYVQFVEFEKGGLLHAQCIFSLNEADKEKLLEPEHVDALISTEIPCKNDPIHRKSVLSHMIHDPFEKENPSAVCVKEECCTKGFPKQFREEIRKEDDVGSQYYVNLKRTSQGHGREKDFRRTLIHKGTSSFHKNIPADNSRVVSYNPHLLRMFVLHIYVEICLSIEVQLNICSHM